MSKKGKRLFFLLFLMIFIGIIGTTIINLYIINSTKNDIVKLDEIKNVGDVDAILVLGCKVNGNSPSLMLSKRLEMAYDVYNLVHTKIILSGDHRDNYDEVSVMYDYMLSFDIPKEDIILDYEGFSTYDSIYNAKYIFGLKKIIVITQNYHMYRALYLANNLDIKAIGVEAYDIPQKGIMLKNEIREILSRDKAFLYGIIKPQSKYLGDKILITGDGNVTNG